MFAVIGLGNPGSKYEQTRHNVGFRAVTTLAGQLGANASSKWETKLGCSFLRLKSEADSYILIMPQKYMNLSGEAAVPLLRFFKIEPEDLVVVYDEMDFEPGVVRVKKGGSAAGHGGLTDIIRHLGTDAFYRVRIGIGHPSRKKVDVSGASASGSDGKHSVTSWVLGHPGPGDKELIDNAVPEAAAATLVLLKKGLSAAQQEFHGRVV